MTAGRKIGTLAQLGEFGLIDALRILAVHRLPPDVTGIGDDCAVIPAEHFGGAPGKSLLITTDTMVEGRHFRWEYTSAEDLGWKLLAVSLSDVAAMGGLPKYAVVTLQLRADISPIAVEQIYRGIESLAAHHDVHIVGGDTTQGTECALGLTLLGLAEARPVLRSGAKLGDEIWVSGTIGGAGAALRLLDAGKDVPADLRQRYCKPVPRIGLGFTLATDKLAHAMIDVSDGVFQDLGHILQRSGVAAELDLATLPVTPATAQILPLLDRGAAGDDYELVFTARADSRSRIEALGAAHGLRVSCVGTVISGTPGAITLLMPDGSRQLLDGPRGFQHFS